MSKGFTLIEFIIYIGIVAAILVIAVNFSWEIIYGNIKSQSLREVQQNGRFALEKVIRGLRAGNKPETFSVSDGVLYQEGIALTADQVKVTSFTIDSIANTYRVKLSIEHLNPGARNEYEANIDLESTVVLLPTEQPVQGCWAIGGICDSLCQRSDYGSLVGYYIDPNPGCSGSCAVAGSFYTNPSGTCSNDGTGVCYRMDSSSTQSTSCSQGTSCGGACSGSNRPCSYFNNNPTGCPRQMLCTYNNTNRRCTGTSWLCSNSYFQASSIICTQQLNCAWTDNRWYWNLGNSQEGYSSYTNCEWYVQ